MLINFILTVKMQNIVIITSNIVQKNLVLIKQYLIFHRKIYYFFISVENNEQHNIT